MNGTFNYQDALQTAAIDSLPIFQVGKWNGDFYSLQDLQSMVSAFHSLSFQPTVKAGHQDGQDDQEKARRVFGMPSLGYVKNLYVSGDTLYADLYRIPARFARLIEAGAYSRVSSEVFWNYNDEASGKVYPRALKSVAFLGVEIPAITTLDEVENLYFDDDAEASVGYDVRGRQFRIYTFDNPNTDGEENENMETHTYSRPGDEVAARAKAYSQETGASLRDSTRAVLQEDPKLSAAYHSGRTSYAAADDFSEATRIVNELCASLTGDGGTVPPEGYDALLSAIVTAVPVDFRQQMAGDKLDRLARGEIARNGLPNLLSKNYPGALRQVQSQYPALAKMWADGTVSVDALAVLLPKGETYFGEQILFRFRRRLCPGLA